MSTRLLSGVLARVSDDDSELVARLRGGDAHAFDVVYERYRARLFSFLVRLSRDRALAEDLSQELWLRFADRAPGLAPDTRLRAWLYTVARNLFVSHRRWALLDLARVAELELWRALAGEPLSPFALHAANELEVRVELALAALPARYRETALLCLVEGLEPSEAARVLELRPEAVRQRLARARGMLAQALESMKAPRAKDGEAGREDAARAAERDDPDEPTS